MSDNCKIKVKNMMKETLKEENLDKFLSEDKLDMFIQDIQDQKALWGGDHVGYKKAIAGKIKAMEMARKIETQKRAFNAMAVGDQKRFITETLSAINSKSASTDFKELMFVRALGGYNGRLAGGSNGTANKAGAMFDSVVTPGIHRLKDLGTFDRLAKGVKDPLQELTLREVTALAKPGHNGQSVTGDLDAFESAKAIKSMLDSERDLMETLGLPSKRLEGYALPHKWDRSKVAKFKDSVEFRDFIEKTFTVDEQKVFGKFASDEGFKAEYYQEMYNSILTGGDGFDESGAVGDQFITVLQRRDYYKNQAQARKLHFMGENDEHAFLTHMGNGNYLKTITDTMDSRTRSIALMQDFGTDPLSGHAAYFTRVKQALKQKYKNDPAQLKQIEALQYDSRIGLAGSAQDMFNYMSGKSFTPGHSMKVKVASIATTVEALSKLGSAAISAGGDLPRSIAIAAAMRDGNPIAGVFAEAPRYLGNLISAVVPKGLKSAEGKKLAQQVGFLADAELHVGGFSREDAYGVSSLTQWINRNFNKASGLEYVTVKTQQAMAIHINKQLASAGNFHQLTPGFKQNYIDRYGFTERSWQALQAVKDGDVIDIESIDKLSGFTKKEKLDAKLGYFKAIADMTELASGEANARAKFVMTAGKPLDDVEGTARKIFMQFKSFMFSQHHALSRAFNSGTGTASDLAHGGTMVVMTAAGWMAADQLKKAIRGKELTDYSNPKNIAGAMVKSGALTPFTELVLGPSRFDSEYEKTAMAKAFAGVNYVENGFKSTFGPASGLVWDSAEAFGKAMEGQYRQSGRALQYMTEERIPFKNLWYRQAIANSETFDSFFSGKQNRGGRGN